MRQKISEIPGKVICEWDASAKAMVDTWSTYNVSLDEFKDMVINKGVTHAQANGVKAWIVDSHEAQGVFNQDIQSFIQSDVFPTFAKIGVKYFMTINSENALTNMTISQYTTVAGPNGLKVLQGSSANGAIEWLNKNP